MIQLPPDLVSVKEAAILFRVHRRTVWRLISKKKIPAYGPRHSYRVSITELAECDHQGPTVTETETCGVGTAEAISRILPKRGRLST